MPWQRWMLGPRLRFLHGIGMQLQFHAAKALPDQGHAPATPISIRPIHLRGDDSWCVCTRLCRWKIPAPAIPGAAARSCARQTRTPTAQFTPLKVPRPRRSFVRQSNRAYGRERRECSDGPPLNGAGRRVRRRRGASPARRRDGARTPSGTPLSASRSRSTISRSGSSSRRGSAGAEERRRSHRRP